MKKLFYMAFAAILMISMFMVSQNFKGTANDDLISVYVGGEKLELAAAPIIFNNRALVPLRGVFEKLGAKVDWNSETGQAIIKHGDREVLLEKDKNAVLLNGEIVFLDTQSKLQDGSMLVPVRFIAESFGCRVDWDADKRQIMIVAGQTGTVEADNELPTLSGTDALIELLSYNMKLDSYINRGSFIMGGAVPEDSAVSKDSSSNTGEAPALSPDDHSTTNVQTQGVDEGDIVKTNGKNIFYLNSNTVQLVTSDPTAPKVVSTITIPNERGYATDLYIEGESLVIIGSGYVRYGYPAEMLPNISPEDMPAYSTSNTFLMVYDIADPSKPVLRKDFDFEGQYVSSRLIKDKLYLVTNKRLDMWRVQPVYGLSGVVAEEVMKSAAIPQDELSTLLQTEYESSIKALYDYRLKPKFADNITKQKTLIELQDIKYFPDHITPNFMLTVGVDLSDGSLDVKAYLGSAETVYASQENLYLSFTKYTYQGQYNTLIYVPKYDKSTSVYKFGLKDGKIDYQAKGSAPGAVLNQFSFDEYNGNVRIATTTGEMWDEKNISKNNIYILDSQMKQIGSLTGIAEGERIYSTRFAGGRIYMVTFKQVDPFFVIDAQDPTKPKMLGYLKIPGFSTYMHILDENHILGFGTETVDMNGAVRTGGFKLSLFDVTDPAAPIEKSKEVIGKSGTYSELQYNHKALMISLEKGLMAFPLTVCSKTPYVYDFSGAYVYNISTSDFSFKGLITHDAATAGDYGYKYYGDQIQRMMYIGDYLYSVSSSTLQVNRTSDMQTVGRVDFKQAAVPVVKSAQPN